MACHLYNTERCLQLQLFKRPNFGVHFIPVPCHPREPTNPALPETNIVFMKSYSLLAVFLNRFVIGV